MLRRVSSAIVAAVARAVGVDELLLLLGFALTTVALWPAIGVLALLVPGAAITWIALPPRQPFVARPPELKKAEVKKGD
jgi:hypothetical protein